MTESLKDDKEKIKMGLVLGGFSRSMLKILKHQELDHIMEVTLNHILNYYNCQKHDLEGSEDQLRYAALTLIEEQGGFIKALTDVGKVGTFGADKYKPDDWTNLENGKEKYLDAALRHIFKYIAGEMTDKEMQLPHLAAATWNLLAAQEFIAIEKELSEAEIRGALRRK